MSAMFDLHVHAAPDIVDRRFDDTDTVRAYERAGFSGCVLKAHYESTVGRAAAAGRESRIGVHGGLALNQHVGGVNPAAVAAALAAGARVVWFPTADAHTQRSARLPSLCDAAPGGFDRSYAIPPVDADAAEAVEQVCALIGEYDAVLATGHLSGTEVHCLLPTARRHGVRRILLTHPSYTVPGLSAAQTTELTRQGALAEVTTFQLLHQPGWDAARLARFVAEVGPEHIVLSSDAGQPDSPPAPEALALLVDSLAAEGLPESELLESAATRPRDLVVP